MWLCGLSVRLKQVFIRSKATLICLKSSIRKNQITSKGFRVHLRYGHDSSVVYVALICRFNRSLRNRPAAGRHVKIQADGWQTCFYLGFFAPITLPQGPETAREYIYVYMYLYIHMYIHICTAPPSVCTCTHIYICIHMYMYMYIIYICICICIYVRM